MPRRLILSVTFFNDYQSILEYNGGDIIAMAGKECVGIASDTRLGCQAQTVATDFEKIFKVENCDSVFFV